MIVIPAVDIRGGKCVRLTQGKADEQTVYDDNPLEVAVNWETRGAQMVHVVDLDGAFEGVPQNSSLIESILLGVHVPVQVGGGVRSPATVERYISAGAARIVLGTLAYHNYGFVSEMAGQFPERIVIGIDARDGQVAVDGWTRGTKVSAAELAADYETTPIAGFVYTDIARDGMLTGPNIEAVEAFAKATPHKVIASGGVGNADHIRRLRDLNLPNVEGVIVGRALYTGDLTLADAMDAVA